MRNLTILASLCVAFGAGAAHAATSTFSTDNEGWSVGSMDAVAVITGSAIWNPAGYLQTQDVASEVAFFAPGAYLGNQGGAYGTNISFDSFDTQNDGVVYAALVLYGAGKAISIGSLPPSTSGFSHSVFSLTEAGFSEYFGGGIQGSAPITEAEFRAVLGGLTAMAFHADWKSGDDDSGLDNVIFNGSPGVHGVPEPATWAMMIVGLGGVGILARRRRAAIGLAGTAR
jgi:hypothetical protein